MFNFTYLNQTFQVDIDLGEPRVSPDNPGAQAVVAEAFDQVQGYFESHDRREFELSKLLHGDFKYVPKTQTLPKGAIG